MEPVFVIFTLGGFFKLLAVILGPELLGLLSAQNDLYILFNLVGDTCFAFFPIYIAYTSAKRFGANVPMALVLACILINPVFIELFVDGGSFTVYGLPVIPTNYMNSFLPTLLITYALSRVENMFKNLFPDSIRFIFYPIATMLVMLPVALVFLGPIGNIVGMALSGGLNWLQSVFGPLATGLVGALFPFLIVTGMHHALNSVAMVEYLKVGSDSLVYSATYFMDYQLMSLLFATLIKSKNKEQKALALSCIATEGIGGISEPTIFGFVLQSKRNMLYIIIGGFVAGFYIGLMNVKIYVMSPGGFLGFLAYTGGSVENLVHGVIACIIAFVIPFTLALVFGLGEKEEGLEA